jgi:thioredoxin-related protein
MVLMQTETYLPQEQLGAALERARKEPILVLGMLTSAHCPFCIAIKREQLTPRMRSSAKPAIVVVEFDVDRSQEFNMPNGQRLTARQWGKQYGMTLTPTVAMLNEHGGPLGTPLVGYASRDFYAIYLEEHIQAAAIYWQRLQGRKARP